MIIQENNKIAINYGLFSLVLLLLVFLYHSTACNLVTAWNTNPDYSHGYLIPLISLYMLWHINKEKALVEDMQPSNWGLLPLVIGITIQAIAVVGSEHFLQAVSLIIILWGLSLYLLGWRVTKYTSLPIGYLIFMVPLPAIIWNKFSFYLKLQASNIAAFLLSLSGKVPFIQEGNIFHISGGSLEVADACSGIRSLVSLLALGVLVAYFSKYGIWKKLTLVILSIPIAIIANVVRVIFLVFMAQMYGMAIIDSFFHTLSGMLVFVVGFGLILLINMLFRKKFWI